MFYNKNNDLDGDPYGIRTRVAAVKGRWIYVLDYPNRWFTWVYYPVVPTHSPSKSVNIGILKNLNIAIFSINKKTPTF